MSVLRVAILAAMLASHGFALQVRSPEQDAPVDVEDSGLSFREVADADVTADVNDTAGCTFMTNKGPVVNCGVEYPEHQMVQRFLPQHSTVLEIGSRFGLTSCHIANKQLNSGKLVAVEADPTVGLANSINARARRCTYHYEPGAIGNTALEHHENGAYGYGSSTKLVGSPKDNEDTVVTPVKMLSVAGLEKKHNLKFDAIVADCEGCFIKIVEENPGLLNQIHTLIIEQDGDSRVFNYANFEQQLKNAGLNQVGEIDSPFPLEIAKNPFQKQEAGKTYWPVRAYQRGGKDMMQNAPAAVKAAVEKMSR